MSEGIVTDAGQTRAIDALVSSQGPLSGRGWALAPVAVSAFLGFSMLILRAADGPRVYFDGVVARGASVALWLMALPLAARLARLDGGPLDPGLLALAALRGVPARLVWERAVRAAALSSARRTLFLVGPLAALSALLSLPEAGLLVRRLVVGAAIVAIASISASVLSLLALSAAKLAGRRGRPALAAVLVIPWVVASLAGVEALSFPGAYEAAVDGVLRSLAP